MPSVSSSLEARARYPSGDLSDQRTINTGQMLRTLTLARLGRAAEARALIEPALALQRDLVRRNPGDVPRRLEMAQTLYAASQTDPAPCSTRRWR